MKRRGCCHRIHTWSPLRANHHCADGAVDVADVVETVNQIQGSPSSRFIFDAADMNKDRDVNADDVIQIVNAIMSSK